MAALIAGLILVVGFWVSPSEPSYKGRKISDWLRHFPKYKQASWRETEEAMRAFGTNGIPYILDEMTKQSSAWRMRKDQLWLNGPLWLRKYIDPPRIRFSEQYAPEVFWAIGTNSIPYLIDALKQDDKTIQRAAILALGHFGTHAQSALPELENYYDRVQTDTFLAWTVSQAIKEIDPKRTSKVRKQPPAIESRPK